MRFCRIRETRVSGYPVVILLCCIPPVAKCNPLMRDRGLIPVYQMAGSDEP